MNSFRPLSGHKRKKKWFMLKQGLNCNFNFYIVKNWSASWWPNLVTNIIFDLMGVLWDVCWPHWPSLAKIGRPPSVRSGWLTNGLAVKDTYLRINYIFWHHLNTVWDITTKILPVQDLMWRQLFTNFEIFWCTQFEFPAKTRKILKWG